MSGTVERFEIGIGDDVYGSDGDKVGTVSAMDHDYLVEEKGFSSPRITTSRSARSTARKRAKSC